MNCWHCETGSSIQIRHAASKRPFCSSLSEINNALEQGKLTPRLGFWRWNVKTGEVTFRVENTRDDGLEELRDQYSGTWEGFKHPEHFHNEMEWLITIGPGPFPNGNRADIETKDGKHLSIFVDKVEQSSDGTVITITGSYWDCTPFRDLFHRIYDFPDPFSHTLEAHFNFRLLTITDPNSVGIYTTYDYQFLEEGDGKLLNEQKRAFEKYVGIFDQDLEDS